MPEIYLTQPRVTCNTSEPFTKSKEKIQKQNKKTGLSRYIYITYDIYNICNIYNIIYILKGTR